MEAKLEEMARKSFIDGIKNYMSIFMHDNNNEDQEKMISGVQAFMWTNYYREPYMPVDILAYESESKKWWEFWK